MYIFKGYVLEQNMARLLRNYWEEQKIVPKQGSLLESRLVQSVD